MSRFHLDTDFLIFAVSGRGLEWRRLRDLVRTEAVLEMSAVAWFEFCRGPRTPEQTAAARDLFGSEGIIAFDEPLSEQAADQFRRLGSPRKRAADIAIGVSAASRGATLLTRNAEDFRDIAGLVTEVVAG